MDMTQGRSRSVTVVITQRETFSRTRLALQSVLAEVSRSVPIVYIDGGSPESVRSYLQTEAERWGFTLVRTERYLSPNEARNLGLDHADTKYVVFIDNDVLVAPGWMDALVECAEETGAWLVGPLYCEGLPPHRRVHMAGGLAHITEEGGRRHLHEEHFLPGRRVAEISDTLQRRPTELLEFHCLLARAETFDRLGRLDEALLSMPEHVDLCLAVQAAGGSIFIEPRALVTFMPPPPFALSDIPFFALRWSPDWNRSSVEHFVRKWNLGSDALAFQSQFLDYHRHLYYHKVGLFWPWGGLRRLGLRPVARAIDKMMDIAMERAVLRGARRRRTNPEPSLVRTLK